MQEINGYLCMSTLRPIEDNRAQSTLKCPLCGSIVARAAAQEKNGQLICQTCQLCPLDEDVMGLNIKIERTGATN